MKKRTKPKWQERVERGIDAERVLDLGDATADGPLGWLELRAELEGRLKSSGGRPSDPTWDIKRNIPFSRELWGRLRRTAKELSDEGRQISAGHLAAQLVEQGLARFDRSQTRRVLRTAEVRAPYEPATPRSDSERDTRQEIEGERMRFIAGSTRTLRAA